MSYNDIAPIVWVVFLGICFGAFYAYYHRTVLGNIVRALIDAGCDSEMTAKTLSEIGYCGGIKRKIARNALKKGSVLRKTVLAVFDELPEKKLSEEELFVKKNTAPEDQKYYIPLEKQAEASVRYDGEGTTFTTVIITVAVFFVVAIIVITVLPNIIRYISSSFGAKKQNTAYTEQTEISESYEENGELGENETPDGVLGEDYE